MSPLAVDLWNDAGSRFAGTLLAVVIASTLGSPMGPWPATVAALLAAVLLVGDLPLRWRLATAAASWAIVTGFVVNEFGELTFSAADLVRLAVFSLVLVGLRMPGTMTPKWTRTIDRPDLTFARR